MEELVPTPPAGRRFAARRRIRLTDLDPTGRLRLDAVARLLQETAIDDVDETGWGAPEHLWFVRRMEIRVLEPPVAERELGLVTWCSGLGTVAAGRRWSLVGDRGGRIEVESVWIHLDARGRPARIVSFDAYADAAAGRRVSARPELPGPPPGASRRPWPLRASDIDLHGHVNNTVYWEALEHVLHARGPDPRGRLRARLEFRAQLDLGHAVELAAARDGDRLDVGFVANGSMRAVAAVEPLRARGPDGPRVRGD